MSGVSKITLRAFMIQPARLQTCPQLFSRCLGLPGHDRKVDLCIRARRFVMNIVNEHAASPERRSPFGCLSNMRPVIEIY